MRHHTDACTTARQHAAPLAAGAHRVVPRAHPTQAAQRHAQQQQPARTAARVVVHAHPAARVVVHAHPAQAAQQQQQQHAQRPQPQREHRGEPGRRAVLAAAALLLGAWRAPAAALAVPPPNAAVLEDLKRFRKEKRLFGDEEPGTALAARMEAVQAQLQRCELLVRIGQYDNARMQLREGAFKTLRLDLGYGQEMYRLVSQQMARDVVEGVERLDQALKRRDPAEVVQPMIQRLAERVKDVAVAVDRMGEIQ